MSTNRALRAEALAPHKHVKLPFMPGNDEGDPLLGNVDAFLDEEDPDDVRKKAAKAAYLFYAVLVLTIIPTLFFAVGLFIVMYFYTAYPFRSLALVATISLIVLLFAMLTIKGSRLGCVTWLLCSVSVLIGIFAGLVVLCRGKSLADFYRDGRIYTNVIASQPAYQFTDAGIVSFDKSGTTRIDTSRHGSFKDRWTGRIYCAAPVLTEQMVQTDNVNFWAVGIDCCDLKTFRCGELSVVNGKPAHSSLVLPPPSEIAPMSWLERFMPGAADYQHYADALKVAVARNALDSAVDAMLLRWTFDPLAYAEGLRLAAFSDAVFAIIVFAAFAALVALLIAPKTRSEEKARGGPVLDLKKAFRRGRF